MVSLRCTVRNLIPSGIENFRLFIFYCGKRIKNFIFKHYDSRLCYGNYDPLDPPTAFCGYTGDHFWGTHHQKVPKVEYKIDGSLDGFLSGQDVKYISRKRGALSEIKYYHCEWMQLFPDMISQDWIADFCLRGLSDIRYTDAVSNHRKLVWSHKREAKNQKILFNSHLLLEMAQQQIEIQIHLKWWKILSTFCRQYGPSLLIYPTSVIRRFWSGIPSGSQKTFEISIRRNFRKLCISIRTKIILISYIKKWSGDSNFWFGTRFHWSGEKMLVFRMTEVGRLLLFTQGLDPFKVLP